MSFLHRDGDAGGNMWWRNTKPNANSYGDRNSDSNGYGNGDSNSHTISNSHANTHGDPAYADATAAADAVSSSDAVRG